VLGKQLIMEGFTVKRWNDRWDEGIKQNLQWIKEVTGNFKSTEYYNVNLLNIMICRITSEYILLLIKACNF
jgi:hypothetical protein